MAVSYGFAVEVFFAVIGFVIPVIFIYFMRAVSRNPPSNPVKNAPYEGTEASLGSKGIDNEYIPYIVLFIPFNVVISILIMWSLAANIIDYDTSVAIIFLVASSMAFTFIGYKMIGGIFGKANAQ